MILCFLLAKSESWAKRVSINYLIWLSFKLTFAKERDEVPGNSNIQFSSRIVLSLPDILQIIIITTHGCDCSAYKGLPVCNTQPFH